MQVLMDLAEFLHIMSCKRKHPANPHLLTLDPYPEEYGCLYYLEEQLDDAWSRDAHQFWLGLAEELMEVCKQTKVDIREVEQDLKNLYRIQLHPKRVREVITNIMKGAL